MGICNRERHRGPLVVIAEAPGGEARLRRALPLLAEFPLAAIPPHSGDSAYPALGWQPKAARAAVIRLAAAAPWFQVRVAPALLLFSLLYALNRYKLPQAHCCWAMPGALLAAQLKGTGKCKAAAQ